jgi:predicted nuclease of predicted toxin-antitoxin system
VFYTIDEIRALEDEVILQIAANEKRILITKDKDFGELVMIPRPSIFPLHYCRTVAESLNGASQRTMIAAL